MTEAANHIMAATGEIPFEYAYRTIAIGRLSDLQRDIDRAAREGGLSDNPVFRGYVGKITLSLPEKLPGARTIIIMAVRTKPALVKFHRVGAGRDVLLPHQYYDNGITRESIRSAVFDQIIGTAGFALERPEQPLPLKLLAARSGLGSYGRNNVIYVDGMGSLHMLAASFTDREFSADNWTELRVMEACARCRICAWRCPTGAIREGRFIIDAGRCLPLYNEVEGAFPEWVRPGDHNALFGCMRCQDACPANSRYIHDVNRLDDISEEETGALLDGSNDPGVLEPVARKLRLFSADYVKQVLPVLSRNLGALLNRPPE